ncbi:MAG: hypothetical protein Q7S29_04010 [Candidatus Peribacter sp.]|nr:hypothetical protein [Candidatus Peribacter sp.]
MKKSFFVTACAVAFSVPLIALAAFIRPSSVLTSLAYDGKPREFEGKFYASVGEGADLVRFFGNVRSLSEGVHLKEIKSSLHVDMTAETNEGDITGSMDMMAYRETLYVRVSNVSIRAKDMSSDDADFLAWIRTYQNRWFTLDLANATADLNEESGLSLTTDQWKEELALVLDTLFTMEHTRFKTGNTFLLSFNPEMWAEALTSSINNLDSIDPDLADQLSGEDMLPVLSTGADYYAHALTARLKVDTNTDGDFRFARIYATLDLPAEDTPVSLAFEGTLQHRTQPVHLDLPKQTEPLEQLFGDVLPFSPLPTEPMPTFDEWWTVPEETPDLPAVSRPVRLPVPSTNCSPDGSVRGIDLSTQELCPGGRESRRSMLHRLGHR